MNRIALSLVAIGGLLLFTNSASAQYYGGCSSVRSYSMTYSTTPYYSYRSYGPGTHISRYAVPSYSTHSYYRVAPVSRSYYGTGISGYSGHIHPHRHFYVPSHHHHGYGRGGISFRIGF